MLLFVADADGISQPNAPGFQACGGTDINNLVNTIAAPVFPHQRTREYLAIRHMVEADLNIDFVIVSEIILANGKHFFL